MSAQTPYAYDPSLAERIAANARAAIGAPMRCCPRVDVREDAEMIDCCGDPPHPVMNIAMAANLPPDRADARIAETVRRHDALGRPLLWWVVHGPGGCFLRDRLDVAGVPLSRELPGMAVDLLRELQPAAAPAALEIHRVRTAAERRAILDVTRVFGMPDEVMEALARPDLPDARYFLGTENGRAVCTAMFYARDGVAGVFNVATIPEAQRRGYGAAITSAALVAAREAGCTLGVLQASEMGRPVYERLGFRQVCTVSACLRQAPLAAS